jgi:hypothetical protein
MPDSFSHRTPPCHVQRAREGRPEYVPPKMTPVAPHRQPTRPDPSPSGDLERELAELSAEELVAALGLGHAPAPLRGAARAAFRAISLPLGKALARFDHRIQTVGVSRAAAGMLDDLGARWMRVGPRPPARGPLLVVSNHPGAYDALVLLASLERDDVAIVAADRRFLRAMPGLQPHLVFVPEGQPSAAMGRAMGLRRAVAHLAGGGASLHFGAGRIEPDPPFLPGGPEILAPWQSGTGALLRGAARCAGLVVPALATGVHSRRAKRLLVTRVAERHGLTTLAPLLQVALRRYRDVDARTYLGEAIPARELVESDDARTAARVRSLALALWTSPLPESHERTMERVARAGPRR